MSCTTSGIAFQMLCLTSLLHQNALASIILLAIPTEADDPFYRLIEHGAVAAAEAHKNASSDGDMHSCDSAEC